jgi:hypothetical protein
VNGHGRRSFARIARRNSESGSQLADDNGGDDGVDFGIGRRARRSAARINWDA